MRKKHSRKWSAAQRRKHAATIAARKELRATPVEKRNGASWIDRPGTAPAMGLSPQRRVIESTNGDGSRHIEAEGLADLIDSIKLIRSTGEGLVALASMLERMDREHVAKFVQGFGLRLDLRAAEASPRPS